MVWKLKFRIRQSRNKEWKLKIKLEYEGHVRKKNNIIISDILDKSLKIRSTASISSFLGKGKEDQIFKVNTEKLWCLKNYMKAISQLFGTIKMKCLNEKR